MINSDFEKKDYELISALFVQWSVKFINIFKRKKSMYLIIT